MEVTRLISCFDKETEELVWEKNIDDIDLNILKMIFTPRVDDPLMYYCYDILETHGKLISKYVDVVFNFNKYLYQLDCFQHYTYQPDLQ